MNESNSFKDAVKKVLTSEQKAKKPLPKAKKRKVKKTYVEEAMGGIGGSKMSPSAITPAYTGGSKGLPPFSKASQDREANAIDMRDIGKEEDSKAKDHGNKPYPLDTVLDFVAQSGEFLQKAQSMIDSSLRKNNVTLKEEQKEILKATEQAIKSSLGNIEKAAKAINSIEL